MQPNSDNCVLIVGDRADLASEIANELDALCFSRVFSRTIAEALQVMEYRSIAIVIFVSSSPHSSSRMHCGALRAASSVPILAVCGRAGDHDISGMLTAGADDCVRHSVSRVELLARIQALIRRAAAPAYKTGSVPAHEEYTSGSALYVDGIKLDLTTCRISVCGKTFALTPNEFRLMAVFMRSPGEVFSREDLRTRVWPNARHSLHLVEVHIANLRSKIEVDPHRPMHILTVRSRGYRFGGD